MILIVSVEDYLHKPLEHIVQYFNPQNEQVVGIKANRKISKLFLLKLFFYYLPFRMSKIITPSDLGGRLVRLILDVAQLLNVDIMIVPAHNHPFHKDRKIPFSLRYLDLKSLKTVGSYSRNATIVLNDEQMKQFFTDLGYRSSRLLIQKNWIPDIFSQEKPIQYPAVFFTEVLQEIDITLLHKNIEKLSRLLQENVIPSLYIKFHPREKEKSKTFYTLAFQHFANVHFLDSGMDSFAVINHTHIVIASFSTVLLEALWLGKNIIILENPIYMKTMLKYYLHMHNHFILRDDTDTEDIQSFLGTCLPTTEPK